MKIIGIGRNYASHAKELGNEVPSDPVVFMMPETALLKKNAPFYYPPFSKDIHHEVELVIRICREGTNIQEKFARKYYDQIGLGIDFTARDLQTVAREKGLPWDISKGFNHSAPISELTSIDNYPDLSNINFHLDINGQRVQTGNTKDMLFSFDAIVAYVSHFIFLKKGDLIYTGTPQGVGPVQIGDKLEGYIENKKFTDFEIK